MDVFEWMLDRMYLFLAFIVQLLYFVQLTCALIVCLYGAAVLKNTFINSAEQYKDVLSKMKKYGL